jgi:kynurenine formamidase
VGEEEADVAWTSGRTWILDPIDGTQSFIHGVPLFANLVALEDRHGPAVGVINVPGLDECVWAGRGRGCFVDGEPAQVSDRTSLRGACIVTSGVLIDIPLLKGVDYLEPGTPIYQEDLEAFEEMTGVVVRPGDAVFVRTGRWARRAALGPWVVAQGAAGLHASAMPWIKARDVAFLGSDVASDVVPSQIEGVQLPVHQLTIVAMGVDLFDNQDLEAVAETAARLNRWEFLVVAAPLAVEGGTGSPVNVLAIF